MSSPSFSISSRRRWRDIRARVAVVVIAGLAPCAGMAAENRHTTVSALLCEQASCSPVTLLVWDGDSFILRDERGGREKSASKTSMRPRSMGDAPPSALRPSRRKTNWRGCSRASGSRWRGASSIGTGASWRAWSPTKATSVSVSSSRISPAVGIAGARPGADADHDRLRVLRRICRGRWDSIFGNAKETRIVATFARHILAPTGAFQSRSSGMAAWPVPVLVRSTREGSASKLRPLRHAPSR